MQSALTMKDTRIARKCVTAHKWPDLHVISGSRSNGDEGGIL